MLDFSIIFERKLQLFFQLENANNWWFSDSDMLLFWCYWFKYRYIKLDLVTVGKFCFYFGCILGGVVDCINNINLARMWRDSPLWKRVIALGQSCAASAYGIIWGDARQNKHGRITAECHSVVCSGDSMVLTELRDSNKIEVIVLHD